MASLVVFVPLLSSNVLAFTVCWWTLFSFVYTQYLLDTMMLPLSCVGCFRTCLATAKLRRPFPDYMWQCTLDAQKGLDVGNTCRTEKACKQSVRAIAEVERCHLHTTWTLVASSPSSVTDQQMHSSQKQIGLWGSQWTVSPLLTLLVLKISARQMLHRSSERAIDSVMEHYLHIPKDTKKLVNLALLSLLDQLMVLPHSSEMSSHVCNRSTAWCSVSSEQAVAGTSDSDCHCCWCACHADVCCGHCCDVYATLMSVVATVVMYMPRWRLLWPPLWRLLWPLQDSVVATVAKKCVLAHMGDYHDETLTGAVFARQTWLQMLGNLVRCLEGHFIDSNLDVVRATSIVSFKLWPEVACDCVNNAVATLNHHFGPVLRDTGIDTDSVETEWTLLKTLLYEETPDVWQLTWCSVNAAHQVEYGSRLGLVDAFLTLPASSAGAERGFSQLKLTKSIIRSTLKADRLTNLLTIQPSCGVPVEHEDQTLSCLAQGLTVMTAVTLTAVTLTVVPQMLSDTDWLVESINIRP